MLAVPTIQSASAQVFQTVQQCWIDEYQDSGPAMGAGLISHPENFNLFTGGTEFTKDDRTRIVARIQQDISATGCNPNIYATKTWENPQKGDAEAAAVTATFMHSEFHKSLYWVGGRHKGPDSDNRWEAVILTYFFTGSSLVEPTDAQMYFYGDDRRDQAVVAMDGTDITDKYGPLVAAAIQTTGGSTPSSTIVVLRTVPVGNDDYEVEEVLTYAVPWVANDVRIEYEYGSPERIRVWWIGHAPDGRSPGIVVGQIDLSGTTWTADEYEFEVDEYAEHVAERFVFDTWQSEEPDLFIVGSAVNESTGAWEALTLRFGYDDSKGEWLFRWHELHPGDDHAFGMDIGVAQGFEATGGGGPGGGSATPKEVFDYIFVAVTEERQISPNNYTNDFTVLCYQQEENLGQVNLHWKATFAPQAGDDRAMRLLATHETDNNNQVAVAVVAGVVENSSGDWNWQLVKYDESQPDPPQDPKTPIWSKTFPLSGSAGDDVPVAITGHTMGGLVPSRPPWNLENFWVTGRSFATSTGDHKTTVHYQQSNP